MTALKPIVTHTRSDWRELALTSYREIAADEWMPDGQRNHARTQIHQLENESPLLEWEEGSL